MTLDLKSFLPDFDYPSATKATVVNDKIVFVTIGHDYDCENPLESCEGMGKILSFGRRHVSRAQAEANESELKSNPDAVALSYFEHGNCMWTVAGDIPRGTEGDWQWDGVDLAGAWVPDKCCIDNYDPQRNPDRKLWMSEQAERACEEYTKWCNGECYFYSVKVYNVRHANTVLLDRLSDYRHDEEIFNDACHGMFRDDGRVESSLAAENDAGKSFAQIADLIEKQVA